MSELYQDLELAAVVRAAAPLKHSIHNSPKGATCDICSEVVYQWATIWSEASPTKAVKVCIKHDCGKHVLGDEWGDVVLSAVAPTETAWDRLDSTFAVATERADELEKAMVIAKFKDNIRKREPDDCFQGRALFAVNLTSPSAADLDFCKRFNRHCKETEGRRRMEEI